MILSLHDLPESSYKLVKEIISVNKMVPDMSLVLCFGDSFSAASFSFDEESSTCSLPLVNSTVVTWNFFIARNQIANNKTPTS